MLTFDVRSTSVGSIEMSARYTMMPVPAYKVSKAALNMLTVQWAYEYKDQGFTFVTISPGVSAIHNLAPSVHRSFSLINVSFDSGSFVGTIGTKPSGETLSASSVS